MLDFQRIYGLLKEISLIIEDGDRRLLTQFNLTVPRYYILYHLGHRPGISLSQLSDFMLCDKSNITRLVRGMETDGLVERRAHESDGRTARLFLTGEGEKVRQHVQSAHTEYNEFRFEPLNDFTEPGALLNSLHELKVVLQDKLPET